MLGFEKREVLFTKIVFFFWGGEKVCHLTRHLSHAPNINLILLQSAAHHLIQQMRTVLLVLKTIDAKFLRRRAYSQRGQ